MNSFATMSTWQRFSFIWCWSSIYYLPQSSPTPSLSLSIWSGLETESQLSAKQIEQQNIVFSYLKTVYCAQLIQFYCLCLRQEFYIQKVTLVLLATIVTDSITIAINWCGFEADSQLYGKQIIFEHAGFETTQAPLQFWSFHFFIDRLMSFIT